MKRFIYILATAALITLGLVKTVDAQAFPVLSQWFYDNSGNITQVKSGTPVLINGNLTVTGTCTGCGGGGGSSFGQAWEIGGNGITGFLAPTTTQKVWIGQASSTIFSAGSAYFGQTATSSFSSTGVLTLAAPLTVTSGGTGLSSFGASQLLYGGSGGTAIASVATSTLSASSPLTGSFVQIGSGGSLGCQTASGSQAGCLSSSDWTTFNGKQSALSVTWPIQLAGSTLSFGGLSTSTNPTVGDLPYWTGVHTFGDVATTSVTNGSGISLSANPGSLVGGSNLTITNTGVLSITQNGGGTAQTGSITLSTTTDSFNGLQANENITNSGSTFTFSNNITGTLSQAGGGTGTSTPGVTNGVEYNDGSKITNNTGFVYNGTMVGIGSTTPTAYLGIQSGSQTAVLEMIATTSGKTLSMIDAKGQKYYGGDMPTLSACGTDILAPGSNNSAGRILGNGSGSVTSCVLTFADGGWSGNPNGPVCSATREGGGTTGTTASSTPTTVTFQSAASFGGAVNTPYSCSSF